MGDLLTVRMAPKEKETLAFSSRLSDIPISKVIGPFISEGTKVSLGAILLFHVDRASMFERERFESFVDLMMGPTTKATPPMERGLEEIRGMIPGVIWDFFDLLVETRALKRLNEEMEEVELRLDTGFVTPSFLRALSYRMGDTYVNSGGSLGNMDYQLACDLFFGEMLHFLYRNTARGTERSLSTQWYVNRKLIMELTDEIKELYNEKSKSRVVEAIVVSSSSKRRGRPPTKKRKAALAPGESLVARELDTKKAKRKKKKRK